MKNACIYIIVANRQMCQIYEYRSSVLKAISRRVHASSVHPLVETKEAHKSATSLHDSHENPTLKDLNMTYFAAEIGDFLEQALNHHAFDKLILIIPPHDEALFEHAITHHLRNKIDKVILKAIDCSDEREVLNLAQNHLN